MPLHRHAQNHRFLNLISLSCTLKSLPQTEQTHAIAITSGVLPQSISLSSHLILSYAAFGEKAAPFSQVLFQQSLPFCKKAFIWNTLLRALSISRVNDGYRVYNRMVRDGVRPDHYTFPFVLKACADSFEVKKGLEIHGRVVKYGFDRDVFVNNTLLAFYGRCGDLRDVKKVFEEMPEKDVVSWNTLIRVVSFNGFNLEALSLFREMNLRGGLRFNSVTVVSVLPVCAGIGDEMMVRRIHCYILKAGFEFFVSIGNALVDAYGKCWNVEGSKKVFNEIVERNEVSWNAIISSIAYTGHWKDALGTFRSMISSGVKPDTVTIASILPVLVELECFGLGKEVHGLSLRMGVKSDVFIANSLIDMYAKAGCSAEASNVFYKMDERDIVSWNVMVANLAQNGQELAAVDLIREMQNHGENPDSLTLTNVLPACAQAGFLRPGKEIHGRSIRMTNTFDLFVTNALMDMYVKCDSLDLAQKVFNVSLKDEVSYNILIRGYSQTSDCAKSLSLFKEMGLTGMKQDVVSFMGAISACANLSAIKQGKQIHGSAIRRYLHIHIFAANSLLDFYTKCGRFDLARRIFDRIPDKDVACWNTMILGYGMLGELGTAFNLFEAMREDGMEHDSVSYLAVLSACSHGGLVEKGRKYFKEMEDQGIKPTQMHFACMVDILGRAGLMGEALGLINSLPMEPGADVWGPLLGACRIYENVELGRWVGEQLLKLKPQRCGYYVLLSNLYAEAGRWDEANKVRELMKSKGAKKNPGCSWV